MKFFLDSGTLIYGQNLTYSIKKVLGHGSFGITYLATTKMKGLLGEVSVQVALKEFFAKDFNERKEDGSVREHSPNSIVSRYGKDFQKEAQNLSRLKNPGIVNVLEAFEANGTYYYSMEYIEGETLDEYIIKKGCLPEMEAIEYSQIFGKGSAELVLPLSGKTSHFSACNPVSDIAQSW